MHLFASESSCCSAPPMTHIVVWRAYLNHRLPSTGPCLCLSRVQLLSVLLIPIYHTTIQHTMPSDLSYWIISAPLKDGDPGIMLMDVRSALGDSVEVGQWEVPELKVCPRVIMMPSRVRGSRIMNEQEVKLINLDRNPLAAPQLV